MTIGISNDENGNLINIIIYVDNEQTANIISEEVKKVDKSETCKYGILCRTKNVRVISNGSQLKEISGNYRTMMNLCFLMFILIELTHFTLY